MYQGPLNAGQDIAPRSPVELQRIIARVESCVSSAQNYANMLEEAASRLSGPIPSPTQKGGETLKAISSGHINCLDDDLSNLDAALCRIQEALIRLNNAI